MISFLGITLAEISFILVELTLSRKSLSSLLGLLGNKVAQQVSDYNVQFKNDSELLLLIDR